MQNKEILPVILNDVMCSSKGYSKATVALETIECSWTQCGLVTPYDNIDLD